MLAYLPLIVCIAGGAIYFLLSAARPEDGKVLESVRELARIAFFAGLLAFLLTLK